MHWLVNMVVYYMMCSYRIFKVYLAVLLRCWRLVVLLVNLNIWKDRGAFVFRVKLSAVIICIRLHNCDGTRRHMQDDPEGSYRWTADRQVVASYGSHFVKQQQSDLSCAFKMADLVYNGFFFLILSMIKKCAVQFSVLVTDRLSDHSDILRVV